MPRLRGRRLLRQQPPPARDGAPHGHAALHFAKCADEVVPLARGDSLRRSMSEYLVTRIEASEVITVRTCTQVAAGSGGEHLERLLLEEARSGEREEVDACWLFLFIGAMPTTDRLGDGFRRDERGFLLAGPHLLGHDGARPAGWPLGRDP